MLFHFQYEAYKLGVQKWERNRIRQRRKGKIDCIPHTVSLKFSYGKEIEDEKMRNGKGKMGVQ
jgi:hypothetical protein